MEVNTVLIASSECELQALVNTLKEECESNGPILNANKTKILVFEKNEERTKCKISVKGIRYPATTCSFVVLLEFAGTTANNLKDSFKHARKYLLLCSSDRISCLNFSWTCGFLAKL